MRMYPQNTPKVHYDWEKIKLMLSSYTYTTYRVDVKQNNFYGVPRIVVLSSCYYSSRVLHRFEPGPSTVAHDTVLVLPSLP